MATNFFENQERARRRTSHLVVLYVLAVLAIVGAVAFLVHITFGYLGGPSLNSYDPYSGQPAAGGGSRLHWVSALVTLAVIGIAMLVRMHQLSGGGAAVAQMLGGVMVAPNTKDPDERRLLNVVEEMAIASGISVPPVYVLSHENGINAFAAGLSPSNAVIGVTRGTMEKLSRDELQGVIAHEFSHIFNGDMKLNLRLIGVLSGIVAIFTVGRMLLYSSRGSRSSRNSKGGAPILFLGVGLMAIGGIGVFFARLIKAAVSRQREYLADASAVQYTRNPGGIGGALLKIRDDVDHGLITSSYAEETSHLFFGSALKLSFLFATHPPIEERVKRVHPALLQEGPQRTQRPARTVVAGSKPTGELARQARAQTEAALTAGAVAAGVVAVDHNPVMRSIGEPTAEGVRKAREFLKSLPAVAIEAAKTAEGAKVLMLSLLLYDNESSEKQKQMISETAGPQVVSYVEELKRQLGAMKPGLRLPILEISVPALRGLTPEERHHFLALVKEVIWADQKYHLLEYVVWTLLSHHLSPNRSGWAGVTFTSLGGAKKEISVLISAFAHVGANTEAEAEAAFRAARRHLNASGIGCDFLEASDCGPVQLEAAMERLRGLRPLAKKRLMEATTGVILSDQQVTAEERELLQAVAIALDVPMPPVSASL